MRFVAVLVAGLFAAAPAFAASAREDSAERGAKWLASKQTSNGAFGGNRSDLVAETLAAVVAGGVGGKVVTKALTYIRDHGEADATKAALTGRIVSGIVAAGGDPRDLGGVDYVEILDRQYDGATGSFDTQQLFPNLLGALGALAAHGDLPPRAVAHIEAHACDGGGFGFNYECDGGADVDTTSLAINALSAAEIDDVIVDEARAYLLRAQRSDGGYGFKPALKTSADSTGLALTAIAALGEDPGKSPWRRSDGGNPVSALRKLQQSSGAFVNGANKADVMATTNAVPGMAGKTYPIPKASEKQPPLASPTPKPDGGSSGDGDDDNAGGGASAEEEGRATPTPRGRRGGSGAAGSTAAPSGSPGEAPDGKGGDDDLEAGGSFDAPEATEEDGPNRLLLGGLFVSSLVAAGTGLWYLRFYR